MKYSCVADDTVTCTDGETLRYETASIEKRGAMAPIGCTTFLALDARQVKGGAQYDLTSRDPPGTRVVIESVLFNHAR